MSAQPAVPESRYRVVSRCLQFPPRFYGVRELAPAFSSADVWMARLVRRPSDGRPALRRNTDAPNYLGEPRIGSYWVPQRLPGKICKANEPFFDTFFQPRERLDRCLLALHTPAQYKIQVCNPALKSL